MDINWHHLLIPNSPAEMVVRGTLVYLALFVMLRVFIRREAGSTGMSDLLFLVLLADAAQNAMAGSYQSITDGLILVGTIVAWSLLLNAAAYRSTVIGRLIRPRSLLLIDDGRLVRRNMRRELLSVEELMGELRQHGVEDVADVERAWMEQDGQISVVTRERTVSEQSRRRRKRPPA